MNPKVSIITQCYNGEKYFERWKTSILKQSYDNIEVLLINDGAVDASSELFLSGGRDFEDRGYCFKYFSQENRGVDAVTSVGLLHMTGDYCTAYDVDDIFSAMVYS